MDKENTVKGQSHRIALRFIRQMARMIRKTEVKKKLACRPGMGRHHREKASYYDIYVIGKALKIRQNQKSLAIAQELASELL